MTSVRTQCAWGPSGTGPGGVGVGKYWKMDCWFLVFSKDLLTMRKKIKKNLSGLILKYTPLLFMLEENKELQEPESLCFFCFVFFSPFVIWLCVCACVMVEQCSNVCVCVYIFFPPSSHRDPAQSCSSPFPACRYHSIHRSLCHCTLSPPQHLYPPSHLPPHPSSSLSGPKYSHFTHCNYSNLCLLNT